MEAPLTRQTRPDIFEPKVVELYRQLFHALPGGEQEDLLPSEGFWRELFLLKPEKPRLYDVLEPLTANNLLQLQTYTRLFFQRCIEEAGSGITPRNENALENLTGFLCAVLSKRYANPSTDIIEVLGGLNNIDKLISDLVHGLDVIVKQSSSFAFRQKAVQTALAMVSGSYQTSLVTYFIHRDLFPALTKFAHEADQPVPEILVLLGLLSNYNKFESQNLYHNRLEDFVNEGIIVKLVRDYAAVGNSITSDYVAVQDDAPSPWSLSSTLNMVGLRALTPEAKRPTPPTEEQAKALFNALPNVDASIVLSVYSFVQANKIFASELISTTRSDGQNESPLSIFLSSTSYLCHHAFRNTRTSNYAILSLLTVRLLTEDIILVKRLSSSEHKTPVRLARQRPPYLPFISSPRIPASAILDLCTDTLSHNLRKRLSIPLYASSLNILHRLIAHFEATKTRLNHHWSYIWGSLFSLLRFLTQYSSDLATTTSPSTLRTEICTPLSTLLALCLSRGDNFLPDPSSYDDLFYKLIETSSILPKFKDAYNPSPSSTSASTTATATNTSTLDLFVISTNALLSVTSHYQSLLTSKATKTHQSPATVQTIIKEGYDTLPNIGVANTTTATTNVTIGSNGIVAGGTTTTSVGSGGNSTRLVDFGHWQKWRESESKAEIKRILRGVVEDARSVVLTTK